MVFASEDLTEIARARSALMGSDIPTAVVLPGQAVEMEDAMSDFEVPKLAVPRERLEEALRALEEAGVFEEGD